MSKMEEARTILKLLGFPQRQQSDLCCLTLLAMSGICERDSWSSLKMVWLRIHEIIIFIRDNYGKDYAENSRETIRKQALHHFRNAAIIEDNGAATNSPNYRYRLTPEMVQLLRCYGSAEKWENELHFFLNHHTALEDLYASKREAKKVSVLINGSDFFFSTGKHNRLQKAIIEEFAPRFVPDPECLYVGDTTQKDLFINTRRLHELGFSITVHEKMPDVVLYSRRKNWLFFVEAVTSVGPMEPKRIQEIEKMTSCVPLERIYVTAFLDFKTYRRFCDSLAWETEVWISEQPGHMIHYNGNKFLGAR